MLRKVWAMGRENVVFINDNVISERNQRGVMRCFEQLLAGMLPLFGGEMLIYSPRRRPYGGAQHIRAWGIPGRMHNLMAGAVAGWHRPRLYLAPYYGAVGTSARQVYLVYDMNYEMLSHHFPPHVSYNRRFTAEKRRCFHAADLLLAISRSTADDILRLYPQVDPAKIVVAHLGVDERFFGAHPWPGEAPARPYLLYVGQRSLYKNFRRLLEAFGESGLAADYDLRVISGEFGGFTAEEQQIIARYGLGPVVHRRSGLSDAELVAYYSHAVALVYPSEYEGFGLPVAEAMAAGTLVATSNRSSMPEVGGEIAFYFDPLSVTSIVATLREVVALPPDERQRRIEAGRTRAAGFSWDRFQKTANAAITALLG